MAATGFTPIYLYYSSTTTNQPLAANLGYGELAINITDGYLFYKDNTNTVQKIGYKLVPTENGGTGLTGFTAANNAIYSTSSSALAAGTLPIAAGGTAQTSFTSGRIHYGSFSTSANLTTDGTDLTLGAGNLIIGTADKGIDFSATPGTGTSELFSDYEEGNWTATLTASTTAPTTPITTTGRYTKVGRVVTVTVSFVNVDTTGASGNLMITGLPYAIKSGSSYNTQGVLMTYGLSSPNAYCVTYGASSETTLYQYSVTDNGGWSPVNIAAGATKFLYLTHTYFA